MNFTQSGIELISAAEKNLRQLVAEAATTGDYAGVVQLAAWAKSLNQLLDGGVRRTDPRVASPSTHTSFMANAEKPSHQGERHRTGRDYPRFFRDGGRLVRVAWSKREKKEYEHKAPLSVLLSLARAIQETATDGRMFSMDKILPLQETEGIEIPNYQAYVALSLMRHTGLLDEHGRQGYSLPRPTEFQNAVDAVWRSLPTE